tara:strand:+ start:330 stop:1046 length:717 start_codon:yes stop_codon:yes gene_type:complete
MSKKTEVKYAGAILDIVSRLTSINQSVSFKKNEDETKVTTCNKDTEGSIAYFVEAPIDYFKFEEDDCSMYNYAEFYSLYDVFEDAKLETDEYDLTVSEGSSTINYRLTDATQIKINFSKVKFSDPDVSFSMDSAFVAKIKKLCGADKINAEYIKFTVNGDGTLNYKLAHSKFPNTFDQTIDVEAHTDEEFTIILQKDSFNKIPVADYIVSLKESGTMEFKMEREDEISVKLYLADTED